MTHSLVLMPFIFAALSSTARAELNVKLAVKIATVDLQKALVMTAAGKQASQTLEKQATELKLALQKKEAELIKKDEALRKEASALSDEARGKRQAELQAEAVQFQKDVNEAQTGFQKKQSEMLDPILRRLQAAVSLIAKEKGYAMVLEKREEGVLFASADLDITSEVVKTVDLAATATVKK